MVVTIRISMQRRIFFFPTVFVIPAIAIQYSEILSITVARSTPGIAYTILYLVCTIYSVY